MGNDLLAFTSAIELAQLYRSKKLSPVELVDLLLRRIEDLNPKLNAYLTVIGEEATKAAKKAEKAFQKGEELHPMFGIPISIKDLFATRGIRTTYGSITSENIVPDEDIIAVERLRRTGAIILGKTNTPEFGMSPTTENRLGDFCRNPWNTDCVTGGSSGGSAAAIAAGLGPLTIGSDGGGSIRIPSSFCGIFGIKPTNGLIPTSAWGGMPVFATSGPMTRTVADAALMLNTLVGYDTRALWGSKKTHPDYLKALETKDSVKKLRIAWSPDLGYAVNDPEVTAIVKAAVLALEKCGCIVEEASPELEDTFYSVWTPMAWCDEYIAHASTLEKDEDKLVGYVKDYLKYGKTVTGVQYASGMREVWTLKRRMAEFFGNYDLLLTPTMATTAFPWKNVDLTKENPHLTVYPGEVGGKKVQSHGSFYPATPLFNMSAQPAATVPCGFASNGLPVGLQIVGRWYEDDTVLQASAIIEEILPWADKAPSTS
ncbi:amidase [Chloroflexota bacterium]